MNSNKSYCFREDMNKRSCNGCRYYTKDRRCAKNYEIECSVDGNYDRWEPSYKTCKKCVWSTDVSGKLFCLFIRGTCLKNDQVFVNAVLNGRKGEASGV